MPARARPESFGAHGAVPPYLRDVIASRRRSRWVRVRTLDRRGPVGQMPRFGYMVYVNGCSSDRHLIYVDRHAGARAVVVGRRLQCSAA